MLLGHSLLGIWLCFVLVAPQGHEMKDRRRDDRKAGIASTLLSHEHYKRLQNQLQAVRTLSRRYWHSLACGLWQENCEEDQMPVMEEEEQKNKEQERGGRLVVEEPGWGFRTVRNIMSRWYCSIGKCCAAGDCRVTNNITGLEKDLSWKLHGQHLAKEVVLKALRGFLETPQPKAALALSFHGWSGTGKNFVARLIAEHLFQDGLKSDCVSVFISTLHFPYSKYVDLYKVQLAKQIRETAQQCEQSLFIFDEAEKLHVDLIEAIRPHMDFIDNPDLVGHRHSIFLFLSNVGGNIINEVALDFWRAGRSREEITMEYLEERLWTELLQPAEEGNIHSHLLKENLVDFLVPFLPLEYHHVKLCARDAFLGHGLQFTDEAIEEVARTMMFVPKEEKLFSAQGCKSVSQRVNYFSP